MILLLTGGGCPEVHLDHLTQQVNTDVVGEQNFELNNFVTLLIVTIVAGQDDFC